MTQDRIVAELAHRFSCYGEGTEVTRHNPIAVTLADQPPTFAFGVPVADVVAAVLELARQVDEPLNRRTSS